MKRFPVQVIFGIGQQLPGSGDIDGEVVPSQDGFLYLLAHGNVQEGIYGGQFLGYLVCRCDIEIHDFYFKI